MRILFMGSSEFAVPTLQKLMNKHEVVAVYSRSAKPAGRGMKLRNTPIALEALKNDIPLFTSEILDEAEFLSHTIDAIVVVSYGLIIPNSILKIPKYCFNVHPSLLPRWRGASPIEHAKMAGDTETGVTVIRMNSELDAGDIVRLERIAITKNTTIVELYEELAAIGASLMAEVLDNIDTLTFTPQSSEGITYARKLKR